MTRLVGDLAGADALARAVRVRTRHRLRALIGCLRTAGQAATASLAEDALGGGGGAPDWLFRGDVRAAISSCEGAIELLQLAERAGRLSGRRRDAVIARLFEAVAATAHLLDVAPRHRADARFVARAGALGRRLLAEAVGDLPLILAPHARAGVPGHRFPLGRRIRTEQACQSNEHPLAADLVLRVGADPVTIELTADHLHVHRGRRVALRAPLPLTGPLTGDRVSLARRPRIGGDGPVLTRTLISEPGELRLGGHAVDTSRRLTEALDLLQMAWPDAAAEVRRFTEVIVPLDEPGTVSYSLLARPGYSYINLTGKTVVQLADDLTHETAHHKLHAVEELAPLLDPHDDALAEPAWWSPWRRAWRPLRGIIHACYTFTHGGLLFARLGRLEPSLIAAERRFAARRLLEESSNLRFSLLDLNRAAADGGLSAVGEALTAEMSGLLRTTIAPAARGARAWLRGGGQAAARELRRIDRLDAELKTARAALPAHRYG